MQPTITIKELSKKYKDFYAVNKVSLEIYPSCFHVIMGKSGSGKTTLLSRMGLLDDTSSGEIWIGDKNVSKLTNNEKADIRMKDFGFVFQSFHLNPTLKAYENVMLPLHINPLYHKKDKKSMAIELLESLELRNREHHFISQLSGGEQQRIAIARALANKPKVIFADEPTGNLDSENEKIVFSSLKKLSKQGKSIVVVSHNDDILSYADRVFYMSDGNLVEKIG